MAVTGKQESPEGNGGFLQSCTEQTGAMLSHQYPGKLHKRTAKGCQNRGQEMKEGNSRGKVMTSGL